MVRLRLSLKMTESDCLSICCNKYRAAQINVWIWYELSMQMNVLESGKVVIRRW